MGGRVKRKGGPGKAPAISRQRGESRRRSAGKLTIQAVTEGDEERQRSLASVRRHREATGGDLFARYKQS